MKEVSDQKKLMVATVLPVAIVVVGVQLQYWFFDGGDGTLAVSVAMFIGIVGFGSLRHLSTMEKGMLLIFFAPLLFFVLLWVALMVGCWNGNCL